MTLTNIPKESQTFKWGIELKGSDGRTRAVECPYCLSDFYPDRGEITKCPGCGNILILPWPFQTNDRRYQQVINELNNDLQIGGRR